MNVAAPKLAKRIELQKIFNSLLPEGESRVDRRQLMVTVLKTPELIGIFTQKQADELGYQGADTTIDWPEFLDFIQRTEASESETSKLGNKRDAKESVFSEEMPPFEVFGELVDPQSKALEVDLDRDGLKVSMMGTDDIRVAMSDSNKLIVDSMCDAMDLVTDFASRHQLPESTVPELLDHVDKAIIKACQQELRLLEAMSSECMQQMEDMASMLLGMEDKMLSAMEDCKRAQFMSGVTSAGRRGSVAQDVRTALVADTGPKDKGGGTALLNLPTPGELARKLSQLQQRVAKKEEELAHYQKLEFKRRASTASLLGLSFDTSVQEDKGREEWRKEVDSRLSMIKVTNLEREVLIRDNSTLRTTVECGRTAGMTDKLRKQIAAERKQRMIQIGDLQNEVAQLEAELRVAEEEERSARKETDEDISSYTSD